MQRIPTKTPTVQKPCIDRASPDFSGLHNKKERQILRFGVQYLVHLQGLEPWAHWLRETNVQQSSISRIAQIRYFYRFPVNLCFASAAFFAPAIPSCIRYPDVPVCKKCAKMCRAKISPLKQVSDFYAKPGKRSGSSPIRQLRSCLFRPSIKCTSTTMIHGKDLDNWIDTALLYSRYTMEAWCICSFCFI